MKTPRRAGDRYYTEERLAEKLVSLLPIVPEASVLEPHAGAGAFLHPLRARGHEGPLVANDVDPDAPALQEYISTDLDFRERMWSFDWIIGNPPFTDFHTHVDHALLCANNVAFLLRLAAMESKERAPLWLRWPLRKVWVLAERPSFTGQGTDSCAYGFFWWQAGYTGAAEVVPGWSWK